MSFPTDVAFTRVYVIYSADILGSERDIEGMGPFRKAPEHGDYAESFPGEWVQTEDDSNYEYGYLGDEGGDARFYPAGFADSEGTKEPDEDDDEYGEGRHRKWVGDLTIDEWRRVASQLCIDIHPNGVPERAEETMGAITEYGHLDAVAVLNTEGWEPTEVIDSSLYVSFALVPEEAVIDE